MLLTKKQRVIRFSDIRSVAIEYLWGTAGAGNRVYYWQVSLNTVDGNVMIESLGNSKRDEEDMYYLAKGLGAFIGKHVVDDSSEPKRDSTNPSTIVSRTSNRLRKRGWRVFMVC